MEKAEGIYHGDESYVTAPEDRTTITGRGGALIGGAQKKLHKKLLENSYPGYYNPYGD